MLGDRNSKGGRQSKFCLGVAMVQKQTIMHYQPQKSRTFLRITVATPNLVTQARGDHSLRLQPKSPKEFCQSLWLPPCLMGVSALKHLPRSDNVHTLFDTLWVLF